MLDELKKLGQELLPSNKINWDKVNESTRLVEDLGFDSITFIMMSIRISEDYDVNINQSDIEHLKTVGDVIEFISTHQ